jgi:PST family polysaccharide transporter
LTRSVKTGVAWTTLTFALTRGLSFLSLLVLTRLLAPSQFGVVGAITVVLGVIELTADLGMGQTVIYEQGVGGDERVQVAFTVNMLLTTALTLAVLAAAPLIASFFHATRHTGLFRLASLDVFLTGLGGVHDGLLLRDLRFSARIITQLAGAVVRAGLGVTLALAGFGAASLVWGLIGGTAAWATALWLCTRFTPTLRFDRSIAASILPYGIGASLFQLIDQITIQVDSTAVGRVIGQRALGLYSVAYRVPTLLLENIANQVSLVAFPVLSRKRVSDSSGVGAATWRLVRYQSLYALPLAAALAVLSRPIVVTLFSSKWRSAAGVFAAVSVMSGISASGFALGDAFKALGRQRMMVGLTLILLPVSVVTIVLVAPYGITAVAWARAAGMSFWIALCTAAATRVLALPVRGTLHAMWPGAVAAGGVVLSAGAVRLWSGLPAVPEIIVAGLAGAAGALAALAVLARGTFEEIRVAAASLRRRWARKLEEAPAPPVGP